MEAKLKVEIKIGKKPLIVLEQEEAKILFDKLAEIFAKEEVVRYVDRWPYDYRCYPIYPIWTCSDGSQTYASDNFAITIT